MRSRETRTSMTLKLASSNVRLNSKVLSKSKVQSISGMIKKISPEKGTKRTRGTKNTVSDVKRTNTRSSTKNGRIIKKLSSKRNANKEVGQADKTSNNKTKLVRNSKRKIDNNIQSDSKIDKIGSKSETLSSHKQDETTKSIKSVRRRTTGSRLTETSTTDKRVTPNKSLLGKKSQNNESKNQSEIEVKTSNRKINKSVDKKPIRSRSVRMVKSAAKEMISHAMKRKSDVEVKRSTRKALSKENFNKGTSREADKRSEDKGNSQAESERSKTYGISDDDEARSPPKRKCKTNVFETLEKFSKCSDVDMKTIVENKAPKRKQNGLKVDASSDLPPTKLVVVTNGTRVNAGSEPIAKKRKTNSSADRKMDVSKKLKESKNEDPYDFEAYLSTITPGKRKKTLSSKKAESMNDAEKTKAAPQKRVFNRKAPQKTAWGGIARKGTTPSHKFFIQPSRPKRKPQQSDHVEEPSPSIAEEIVEFTLQPPFVPVDDFEEPGRPVGVPTSSMIISTPHTKLTAAPLLRPLDATFISPICRVSEDQPRAPAVSQVKSSHSNSIKTTEKYEDVKSKTNKPGNQSCSESAQIENQPVKKEQKTAKKEMKEKDEFEAWLEKFSRELSDIESFELSIERS